MSTLTVADLSMQYESGGYVVRPLEQLSFEGEDGELLAVVGPSGCGKTTLLSCLAGLRRPTSGTITFDGEVVTALSPPALAEYRRRTVGIVFQAFNLIPSLTARGNVAVPLRLAGRSRGQAHQRADDLLALVGLGDRLHSRPGQMSGGQQQRVAIARALALEPKLILADEPTAHLDHIQVEGILKLLRDLASPGRLVVVVTHDDRVANLADRVIDLLPDLSRSDRPPEAVSLAAGEVLFRQGDRGDLVYVIEEGSVEVYLARSDGTEERLNVVSAGAYLGELGPVLNLPRSASVRALTPCRLTGYTVRAFRQSFPGVRADAAGRRSPRRADPRSMEAAT